MHGSDAGIILDAHLVVVLVALLQSAKDRDGIHLIGLVDHHRLEAALQGLVFLEVFLVFVERGGTDGTQLTAGQGRLEDVGGIHGSLTAARTHQGVDFVDEEDDVALGVCHLFDDALETLLKLALVFGTGHQRAHVEREELFVLQVLGHVAAHDTLGQSLHDGGLARSRLTY